MPLRARFPRGATSNIVCPNHPSDRDVLASDNVQNGTSAARGPYQNALPVRSHLKDVACPGVARGEAGHLRRTRFTRPEHSGINCRWDDRSGIQNSKFKTQN